MKNFELEVRKVDGHSLAFLVFDLKGEKVNKFNREVMEEFESLIQTLRARSGEIEALILFSKKSGNFIAGADITLFEAAKTAEEAQALSEAGQNLLNEWEDLPFPRVVAIQGACLGGGCELSLASSAILMSNESAARIGLPETLLGVVPGMGGCIRMPWKVGIAQALDLILSGKTLTGEKAFKLGLADGLLEKEDFENSAVSWVIRNLSNLKSGKRIAREPKLGGMGGVTGALLENNPVGRSVVFKKAREGVLSKTKGQYPAPIEAIRVIQDSGTGYQACFRGESRARAMKREAEGFGRMAATEVSKNCIRLFFLTESIKKATGLAEGVQVESRKVESAAVLGAGVMGGGIAHLLADRGVQVRMKDIGVSGLETGIQAALGLFKKSLKKRAITERQFQQRLARISPTTGFEGFRGSEVVIEAVVEKMEVKQSVLKELEGQVQDSAVIASNTSSLSISKMQSVMKRPDRFVGMHFFNPVHRMPLIEVIRGELSSDAAVSTIFQFSKQLGKTPVVVKDSPGFLVNRLLMPYLSEAARLVTEGVPIEELDSVLLEFGMPMGPIELIDEVGLDVGEKVGHILHDAFGERMSPPNTFEKLLASKRLGKKTGVGFYLYSGQDKKLKKLDPSVYGLIGVKPVPGGISREEILDRCVLGMVNEAARCLEEGVVSKPEDVDLGMIMGTGFPPFRGGLLRFADQKGVSKVIDSLQSLSQQRGMRFEPSAALRAIGARGGFYR